MNSKISTKIEYLASAHVDKKKESPRKYPASLKFVQFLYRNFGNIFPTAFSKFAYNRFTTPRIRAKHIVTDDVLTSAVLSDVPFDDIYLRVYTWGDKNATKTLLLAHGWESRGTALRIFVKPFLEEAWRIVIFDAPAHGDSGGKQITMPYYAKALVSVLEHTGKVDAIISHSFGGGASVFALSQLIPDYVLPKIVMLAPPSDVEKIIHNFFELIHAPTEVRKKVAQQIAAISKMPLEKLRISELAQQTKIQKALIVHDLTDNIVKFEEAEKIVNTWDIAQLLASNGYGHFRLTKNPDIIKRVVDFLK